ncbi:olfactory receptor 51E2-like [Varanus komodoensis]|uniref:olfactory receptor 51E2-like n=1 Tax=Varanus komodoensis TaxID=61221 RepID=UPI001CF7B5E7|nr:olfactory receptor 51E2-like [Varanus komodoensis]
MPGSLAGRVPSLGEARLGTGPSGRVGRSPNKHSFLRASAERCDSVHDSQHQQQQHMAHPACGREGLPPANGTHGLPASFTLVGLPDMEAAHFWLAFPLCAMYLVALVGNATIALVVRAEPALHAPMNLLLCMLAAVDLALSTCTMPKMLALLWFDAREIGYGACLSQMFFIHSLSGIQSTVLLAMAVDRYVAICHPLQHSAVLTRPVMAKVGLLAVARGVGFFLPLPLLIHRLAFCSPANLTHSYCLHQDVMHLGSGNVTPNVVYGLTAILLVMGLDSLLIFVSYAMIIRSVLRLPSREERLRAAGTCVAHICVVLAFYVPLIGLSVVHRFGRNLPRLVQVTMSNVYLLVPPVLNPLVYGARTKEIRKRALRMINMGRKGDPH